jgi:hypothetical protein
LLEAFTEVTLVELDIDSVVVDVLGFDLHSSKRLVESCNIFDAGVNCWWQGND